MFVSLDESSYKVKKGFPPCSNDEYLSQSFWGHIHFSACPTE